MAPVGRPRTTTDTGARAPTTEMGFPSLGLSGWGGVAGGPIVNPLTGGNSPWRMFVDEWEYVPELRWPLNIFLYDQMRTDDQLAGLLTAVMWGIAQLRYVVDPNGCRDKMVKEISEDLNLPILGKDAEPRGRMRGRFSHGNFVTKALLSVLYGHYYFNIKGDIVDGIWRLRKLAPRSPHTIRQINVAEDGGLVSIVQWPAVGMNFLTQDAYRGQGVEVPVDNLIAFIFQQEGMSQIGRSMLRDCYKPWLLKDRNQRIEAINHERAGGVPWAEGAQGMTVDELTDLDLMMRQFRIGENSGGALPYGAKLNIARGTGSDVDKTIKRLDEGMARRFLLQLVNLAQGGQHVGSYALSETFEDFFLVGQRHIAQWYCDTMTEHLIEEMIDWNYGEDEKLTPRLTWERSSEDALGTEQLATLVQRGVIVMDEELENWVRYRYLMPKRTGPRPEVSPGGPRQPTEQMSQRTPQQSGTTDQPPAETVTQAAGGEVVAPSGHPPAEPSWLGKLMDKLSAVLPFANATRASEVQPAQPIHVAPHFHVTMPETPPPAPAPEVNVQPADIRLPEIKVDVQPAEVNIHMPDQGHMRPMKAEVQKGPDGKTYVVYHYQEDADA
jgi:hypothetical protein